MTVNKILCECSDCEKEVEIDDAYLFCAECQNKRDQLITTELFLDSIDEVYYCDRIGWEDRDYHSGFDTEKEKDIYLAGIKWGVKYGFMCLAEKLDIENKFDERFGTDNVDKNIFKNETFNASKPTYDLQEIKRVSSAIRRVLPEAMYHFDEDKLAWWIELTDKTGNRYGIYVNPVFLLDRSDDEIEVVIRDIGYKIITARLQK